MATSSQKHSSQKHSSQKHSSQKHSSQKHSSQKQRISITVDTQLLQEVDKLTKNRSAAVEAGLKLWRKQQIEEQLRHFYQNRSQADESLEQDWTEATQEQAISAWE